MADARGTPVVITGFPTSDGLVDRSFETMQYAADTVAALASVPARTVYQRMINGYRAYGVLSRAPLRAADQRRLFAAARSRPKPQEERITPAVAFDGALWSGPIRAALDKASVRCACVTVLLVASTRIRVTIEGLLKRPEPFKHSEYFDLQAEPSQGVAWALDVIRTREAA